MKERERKKRVKMCFMKLLWGKHFKSSYLERTVTKKSVPLRTSKSEVSNVVGRMWDEGLTVLLLKIQGFWDVMPCHWARGLQKCVRMPSAAHPMTVRHISAELNLRCWYYSRHWKFSQTVSYLSLGSISL